MSMKRVLETVAPTLATALAGPLAGVAMKFIADKFTGGDTGKVEDFLLSAHPTVLAELKLADKEFQKEMRQLDVNLEQIAMEDRKSARQLAGDRGTFIQALLSGLYTFLYGLTLYMFIMGKASVHPEFVGLLQGLLGVLSAAQVQILNFWFGSSRGSKEKTEALVANG